MHTGGFAPSGTTGTRISRAKCIEEQRNITAIMDRSFAKEARWLQPFVQNHAITSEVLAAEAWRATR